MIIKPIIAVLVLAAAAAQNSCDEDGTPAKASSGITEKRAQVHTDQEGWTIEQRNVAERLKMDNTPGAIKHLYVISPMSGEVILYSTVRGKVTSSGKRLAPRLVSSFGSPNHQSVGMKVNIGGNEKETPEVIEDDGTYGDSVAYIYWWDAQGRYHQHFFTGGQIIHVSDQPLPIRHVMINLEAQEAH